MSGVLRADLRRITTTKLWWVALICIFVLSAGYAALPATVALAAKQGGRCEFAVHRPRHHPQHLQRRKRTVPDPRHGRRDRGHRQRISVRHACLELSGHAATGSHAARQSRRVVDLRPDLRDRQRGRRHAGGDSVCAWRTTGRCCSTSRQPGARSFLACARSRSGP